MLVMKDEHKRKYILRYAKLLYAIEYRGRYCEICGLDGFDHPWLMDFHHRDSDEKEYEVKGTISVSRFEKHKDELDKCDLLCVTCHRAHHVRDGLYLKWRDLIDDKLSELRKKGGDFVGSHNFSDKEVVRIRDLAQKGFPIFEIANMIERPYDPVKYLVKSRGIKCRKIKKVIDEGRMVEMYENGNSLREIGRQLGVSYQMISDRLRKLGLR